MLRKVAFQRRWIVEDLGQVSVALTAKGRLAVFIDVNRPTLIDFDDYDALVMHDGFGPELFAAVADALGED